VFLVAILNYKKVDRIFGGHFSTKSSKKSFVVICGVKNIGKFWGDNFRVKTLKKF
jgi:hypothetical protein